MRKSAPRYNFCNELPLPNKLHSCFIMNAVPDIFICIEIHFKVLILQISHPPGSDRMGRLAGHLLNQHNFYPLHPPSEELNVDYPNFIKHGFFRQKPDILLLPSDLRYFAKNVQDTVSFFYHVYYVPSV